MSYRSTVNFCRLVCLLAANYNFSGGSSMIWFSILGFLWFLALYGSLFNGAASRWDSL